MGEVVEEWVNLDDLYHPEAIEYYDPECCCAYCLDVSYARGRKAEAAMFRSMRREGKGKLARLIWRRNKASIEIAVAAMTEALFTTGSQPNAIGGLQHLLLSDTK